MNFCPELLSGIDNADENDRRVREAIAQADPASPVSWKFPQGTYHFQNEKSRSDFARLMAGEIEPRGGPFDRNAVFDFSKFSEVEINANGSTFLFDGLIQPFRFEHCAQVTLKNVTVDWVRPGFSEGDVVEVGPDWADIVVDARYPLQGGEPVVSFQNFDLKTGHLAGICPFFGVDPLERVGENRFRVKHAAAGKLVAGQKLVVRHLYNFSAAVLLAECAKSIIHDLTLLAHPGPGVIGSCSGDIELRRLQVRPSAGRIMSTNVDATHFNGTHGLIDFEDCYFEGMGDDAANVHGQHHFLVERTGPRSAVMQMSPKRADIIEPVDPSRWRRFYEAGNKVELIKKQNLKPYAALEIKSLREVSQGAEMTFSEDLPAEFCEGDLIANVTRLARFRFVRCTARNIRGRAILVQTRGALIEDCFFDHCTGQGIHVDTAAGWWETIGTRDIVIRNNRMIGCGYGGGRYATAAGIVVETECEEPAIGIHEGLRIERNFIDAGGDQSHSHARGIMVTCARDVTITDNTILNCENAVHLAWVKDVTLSGNKPGEGKILLEDSAPRHIGLGAAMV